MEILIPVLIVAGIGLVAGIILAIASVVMAVPKDEKAEAILEVLPGANCGACGFSGCAGYAAALSKGEAQGGPLLQVVRFEPEELRLAPNRPAVCLAEVYQESGFLGFLDLPAGLFITVGHHAEGT